MRLQLASLAACLYCAAALRRGVPTGRGYSSLSRTGWRRRAVLGSGADRPPAPGADNEWHAEWVRHLDSSLVQLTGRRLIDGLGDRDLTVDDCEMVAEESDVVIVSHTLPPQDAALGPIFNYGNAAGREAFELDWDTFVRLPSRRSAEADEVAARQRLLDTVSRQGYISDYSGVRISSSGRRFVIKDAIVWNVFAADGETIVGQAATFKRSELSDAPPRPSVSSDESDPSGTDDEAAGIVNNFRTMCLAFSVNHGCTAAALALASSRLGVSLGGISSATLYGAYTLTALLLGERVVRRFGPKAALAGALLLYSAYVGEFALVSGQGGGGVSPEAVVLGGSVLGGIAAGTLWTAEGAYFTKSAEAFAAATGRAPEDAAQQLRGTFAQTFLAGEVVLKLASSLLLGKVASEDQGIAFQALLLTSLGAAALAWTIEPLGDMVPNGGESSAQAATALAVGEDRAGDETGVLDLLLRDRRSLSIAPFNFAFGFAAAFLQLFVNADILAASEGMGIASIGVAGTIALGTATLVAQPLAAAGKGVPVVSIGAAAFGAFAIALGVLPSGEDAVHFVEQWKWVAVAPLFAMYGVGRSVWEGPFKGTFADLFPDCSASAFSATVVQSGLASTFAFLAFPLLGARASATLVATASCLALVSQAQQRRSSP